MVLSGSVLRAIRRSWPVPPDTRPASVRLMRGGRVCHLTLFIVRAFSGKQESYFSAIGGEGDKPPPDLSSSQVTTILKTNEKTLRNVLPSVRSIHCNQLASNHPIEDRLRVATIPSSPSGSSKETLLVGVFDGHGGGATAEIVSRRLFKYLTLALSSDPMSVNLDTNEPVNSKVTSPPSTLSSTSSFPLKTLHICPAPATAMAYDDRSSNHVLLEMDLNERYYLKRYQQHLAISPTTPTEERIADAFSHLDNDLSEEITENLPTTQSKLMRHFYMSLAVSGACANVLIVQPGMIYSANTGDCRCVIGFTDPSNNLKCVPLSCDHNSDNLSELKRLYEGHPASEKDTVIRYNRLLGQLMPLRAFGDFSFKWPPAQIKANGLTKAFGPRVIPAHYNTPPYLTARPEVTAFPMPHPKDNMFLVIGTDGLWEQFDGSWDVVNTVLDHKKITKEQGMESSLELEDLIEVIEGETSPPTEGSSTDTNRATHLLRESLCQLPAEMDVHIESPEQESKFKHKRLVSFLTLPESVVRNFRDDISLCIVHLQAPEEGK